MRIGIAEQKKEIHPCHAKKEMARKKLRLSSFSGVLFFLHTFPLLVKKRQKEIHCMCVYSVRQFFYVVALTR